MARELQLVKWCDNSVEHEGDVPATTTREEPLDGRMMLLDLCAPCADLFDKDVATVHAWLEQGVLAKQALGVPGKKASPAKLSPSHRPPDGRTGPRADGKDRTDCQEPGCDYDGKTRSALGQHILQKHGKKLSDYSWERTVAESQK